MTVDHFAEAERLLTDCSHHFNGVALFDADPETTVALAAAQVHATLALAAAVDRPLTFSIDREQVTP